MEPIVTVKTVETIEIDQAEVVKNKGFWLTAILILMLIGNAFTAFAYLANPDAIMQAYPKISNLLITFMGLLALVNFVLTIAIWNWRKVGVVGVYLSMAFAFIINLYIGIGLGGALTGLIGGVVLFLTTRKKWQHFS